MATTITDETPCHYLGWETALSVSLPLFDPSMIQKGDHGFIQGNGGSGKKTLMRDLYDKRLSILYSNFYGNDMATRWGNDLTPVPIESCRRVLQEPLELDDIASWAFQNGRDSLIFFDGFYSHNPDSVERLLEHAGSIAGNVAIWKCDFWYLHHFDENKAHVRWLFFQRQRNPSVQEKLWKDHFCHIMNLDEFRELVSTTISEPYTFLVLDRTLLRIYLYRVVI